MTKSKFMRVAAVLMAAVLLTTCAISGTFAKYVSEGNGTTSTAKVAKWGVQIQAASTDSAFASSYGKTDNTYTLGENTVVAASDYNVLAPGTSDSGAATITISGTPEVAARVAITGTVTLTGWTVNAADYCPIVFTVNSVTYQIGDSTNDTESAKYFSTVSALEAALSAALSSTQDFAPNTAITAGTAGSISWSWPFNGNDANDTALGNTAATGTAPSISITQSATVTQID